MKDEIVQEGHPVLRQVAKPIAKKDIGSPALRNIIERMKAALAKEEFGVALAAPQIGEPLRLFVVAGRVLQEEQELPEQPAPPQADQVFINPAITRRSRKKAEMSEGCLSVRGKYGSVMRHERVTLTALDERGKPVHHNASGLLGHIFQHECDHLDGVLYIDKAVHVEEDEDLKSARQKLKEKHAI